MPDARKAAAHAALLLLLAGGARGGWDEIASTVYTPAGATFAAGRAVAAGADGRIYVVGEMLCCGTNYNLSLTSFDAALNPLGQVTWNGSNASSDDRAWGVTTDGDAVYLIGDRQNADFDVFLASASASLAALSTGTVDVNVSPNDFGRAVARTPDGNLVAAGSVNDDIWIAKYTPRLVLIASTTFNGPGGGTDVAQAVAAAPDGSIYAAGYVTSNSGAFDTDIWLAHYDAALRLINMTFQYGGGGGFMGGGAAWGLALSPRGDVYVSGYVTRAGQGHDIWVARYDRSLQLQKSATLDDSHGDDEARAIAVDGDGNAYVTGFVLAAGHGNDIWMAKYDADMVLLSSKTVNGQGNGDDEGWGIQRFPDGDLLVAGRRTDAGVTRIWLSRQRVAPFPSATVSAAEAYPNPFRPALGHAAVNIVNLPLNAVVRIYTPFGELVRTLYADALGTASWDGRNEAGREAASGVYYGRAEGAGGEKTFKVVVSR